MSHIELFSHQKAGARFLAAAPGTKGLFFGMGTGKTLTALHAARAVEAERVVVIAPPIALPMWCDVAGATLHDAEVCLVATKKSEIAKTANVLVLSYAIATARAPQLKDWLSASPDHSVLICDESHALKTVTAQRTKAILGRGGVASGAAYAWLLTGTPITRWNDDMYPFLCRADREGLTQMCGSAALERFQLRYTIRQNRQFPGARFPVKLVVGNRNTEELAQWIYDGGLAMRVDLEEVFAEMPPLTTNRYFIDLDAPPDLKKRLKDLNKMPLDEIRKRLEDADSHLATLRRELGEAKVAASVKEILERIESGQSVLIGAWHRSVIAALETALLNKRKRVRVISGATAPQADAAAQDAWNAGDLDALVCQIASAGVSLNLQHGGNQIIVVEEDWSPSVMDQFYARLWRYGQKKHVHVDILEVDTRLNDAIARISRTKEKEHSNFNAIGREAQ